MTQASITALEDTHEYTYLISTGDELPVEEFLKFKKECEKSFDHAKLVIINGDIMINDDLIQSPGSETKKGTKIGWLDESASIHIDKGDTDE